MSALKMQPGLLDVLRGQPIKLIYTVSDTEFHEYYYATLGLGKNLISQKLHQANIWLFD